MKRKISIDNTKSTSDDDVVTTPPPKKKQKIKTPAKAPSKEESAKGCKRRKSSNEVETELKVKEDDKEGFCNFSISNHDVHHLVVNEIALEGLDGITVESFWIRLSVVTKFELPFSDSFKQYIWNKIRRVNDLEFYELEQPRDKLDILSLKCREKDDEPVNSFPYVPIQENGVLGSSPTYKTRKKITKDIRELSLDEVDAKYGNYLVIVATQRLRVNALSSIISNPIEFGLLSFCILERVGRSRNNGETTIGKESLQLISKDPKIIFHNSRTLFENRYLTKQIYHLKINMTSTTGTVFLLLKNHHEIKTKTQKMTETVVEVLRSSPNYRMDLSKLKVKFNNGNNFRKLCKMSDFQKVVKIENHKYREVYPNATVAEWKIKAHDSERHVRALTLIDPDINVASVWNSEESKEETSDDEEDDPSELVYNETIINQIYKYVKSSGLNGRSLKQIVSNNGASFYTNRVAVRYLVAKNYFVGIKTDNGRTRYHKYYLNCNYFTNNIKTEINLYETDRELENESIRFVSNLLEVESDCLNVNETVNRPENTHAKAENIYDLIFKKRHKKAVTTDLKEIELIFKNERDYKSIDNILPSTFVELTENLQLGNKIICKGSPLNRWKGKLGGQLQLRIKQIINNSNYVGDFAAGSTYEILCTRVLNIVESILLHLENKVQELLPLKSVSASTSLMDSSNDSRNNSTVEDQSHEIKESDDASSIFLNHHFMGPNPSIVYDKIDEDDNEIKIYCSADPSEFNFNKAENNYIKDTNVTLKMQERMNQILEAVLKEELIVDVHNLSKMIKEYENEKGYKSLIDTKSVYRILTRLVISGELKILKIVYKWKEMVRSTTVIMKPSLDVHHPLVTAVVEKARIRFTNIKNSKLVKPPKVSKASKKISKSQEPAPIKPVFPYKYDSKVRNQYGAEPKFAKLQILHKFLFYLIYDYSGQKLTDNIVVEGYDVNNMPTLYKNDINWKMFVPPLPQHSGWPQGWFLICDIILRMPLSILLQVHPVPYTVEALSTFIKNPIKKQYVVKDLPMEIRDVLLHRRKYIFDVYEVLTRLCYIGCVQFGPQNFREKDHVFVYLNRKASLLDTTSSEPGYHMVEDKKYKPLSYVFNTQKDVDNYWYEMSNICYNTKLGMRETVVGTYILQLETDKKQVLISTLKPQTPESAIINDTGTLPGDHRGAAGLDSSLWSCLRRNWISPNPMVSKPNTAQNNNEAKSETTKSHVPKSTIRKVLPRRTTTERVKYDDIDKKLMNSLKLSRPDWNENEERIICISKVVSSFLSPTNFKQLITGQMYRDVLHKLCVSGRNKTSNACLRKVVTLFGRCRDQKLLFRAAKTLFTSTFVKTYFQKIYNDINSEKYVSTNDLGCAFVYLVTYFYKNQHELQPVFEEITPKYNLRITLNKFEVEKSSQVFTDCEYLSSEVLSYDCIELNDIKSKILQPFLDSGIYPKTNKDITVDTIKSLIQAAVGSRRDDPNWLLHLFHLYQRFSDDILRSALVDVRSTRMISVPKVRVKHTTKQVLPVFSKLLQFSFHYSLLRKGMLPFSLFSEAHECFLNIVNRQDRNNNRSLRFITQGHSVALSELAFILDIKYSLDIPKDVIFLNPNVEDHTELIRELAKRYKKLLTSLKVNSTFKNNKKTDENSAQKDELEGEKVRIVCRKPMLKRFLTSWFQPNELSDECETTTIEAEEEVLSNLSDSDMDIEDLELPSKQTNENAVAKSTEDSFAVSTTSSFEAYEKKLETLLHNTTETEVVSNEPLIFTKNQITNKKLRHVDKSNTEISANKSAIVEKNVLPKCKRKRLEKVEASAKSKFDRTDNEQDFPNDRIQYLMNDDLTVEEIMEEMVKDCSEEDRKVPRAENLIRLLVDKTALEDDEESIDRLHDHFLIKSPNMKMEILKIENSTFNDLCASCSDIRKKILKKAEEDMVIAADIPTKEEIRNRLIQRGATNVDIKTAEDIIQFAFDKEVLGCSTRQLKDIFVHYENLNLSTILHILTEMNVLLRAGITYIVYVHYNYRKTWLIETGPIEDHMDEEEIKTNEKIIVKLMPWSNIDGSLNVPLFEQWLVTIIGYCISNFMTPLCNIITSYYYLKPVNIYYLLECLQEMGCVHLMSCRNKEKISLLSAPKDFEIVPALITDEFEDICVKVDKLAVIKFGSFLNKDCKEFEFPEDETLKYETF